MKMVLFTLTCFYLVSTSFAQILTADQIYLKTNNAIVTIFTFDQNDHLISQGSGVILNEKGWVVTNYHVYEGSNKMVVKHENKVVAYSSIIAYDVEKDILILKITDRSFPFIPIGNSDLLKVGEKIYAIGSPFGFENTISEGIVSGLRTNQDKSKHFIQISAAISSGSSGGAVVNTKGELVAITSSTITKGQNLNFAIPVNEILKVYKNGNNLNNSSSDGNTLYPINTDNKFGYINGSGNIVIKPQFDYADDFEDGLAKIKADNKYGFIDRSGKLVIRAEFEDVGSFHEGMAQVKISGKYGFIDKKGNIIIKPRFVKVSDFSEGLAKVIEEEDFWIKKGGYIDQSGIFIITYQGADFDSFSEGLAAVNLKGKYGFIDKKGNIIIKPQFSYALSFREGIAWVCKSNGTSGAISTLESDAQLACIDKSGDFVIPFQRLKWPTLFYEGLASVKLIDKSGIGKYCYIDKTGNVVIKPQFDGNGNFHEGLASVKVQDKYGYINKAGIFHIEPMFDGAADFKDGVAKVWIGKNSGYINKSGNWIWNPQNLQSKRQPVQVDDKKGFNSLKIGDEFSKYISSAHLLRTDNNLYTKTYGYSPSDNDLYKVFNLKMDEIRLTFNKSNLLVDIIISKSYRSSRSFEDAVVDSRNLDAYFTNIFGSTTGKVNVNNNRELKIGRVWGNSTITIRQYVEDYGMSNGSDLKINISDNEYLRQSESQGITEINRPSNSQDVNNDNSAIDIIENYLATIGGKEELTKVNSISAKLTLDMMGRSFSGVDKMMNPNKHLTELKIGKMTVMKSVFDGTKGYQQQGPQKTDLTELEIKEALDRKGVIPQLYYIGTDYKTEYLGTGKIGDETIFRLKIIMPSGRISIQEYSSKMGLLLNEKTTSKQGDEDVPMTVEYKNYKKLANIMLPYEITRSVGGQEFTLIYTDIKINEGVTAADFD